MAASVQGAWLLFVSGRVELAREMALELLAENPEDPEATAMLARATWALRRDEESLQCARRALGLDPTNEFVVASLVSVLLGAGRLDEALHVLNDALRHQPDSVSWLGMKAWVETCLGRHEAAITTAREGMRIDPSDIDCVGSLAHAEFKRNRLDVARTACESILRRDPENLFAHRLLGSIALASRRVGEARARLIEALRLDPSDESVRGAIVVALRSRSIWGRMLTSRAFGTWAWLGAVLLAVATFHGVNAVLRDRDIHDVSMFTLRSLAVLLAVTVWGLFRLGPELALAPALWRREDRKYLSPAERAGAWIAIAAFAVLVLALIAVLFVHPDPKYRVIGPALFLPPAMAASVAVRHQDPKARRLLVLGAGATAACALLAYLPCVVPWSMGGNLNLQLVVVSAIGSLLVIANARKR